MGIFLSIFLPLCGVIIALAALSIFFEPKHKPAEPYLKFRKGTTIVCPNPDCGLEIGVANRDIWSNHAIASTAWDSEYIRGGSGFNCPKCSTKYGRIVRGGCGELHTKDGWINRSPEVAHAA